MTSHIHHVALNVQDLDWYVRFFTQVFGMTVQRTRGQAPARQIWFAEGIQLNEAAAPGEAGSLYDHLSVAVENIPETVRAACDMGCTPLPNGAHWFMLPNGAKVELKS